MDPSAKKRKAEENGAAGVDCTEVSGLSTEDARKIIEPFTNEQLVEILKDAVIRHTDVLDDVRSIADRDPSQRKLFIRGLGWETTTEGLKALFSSYGELEEAIVILDKATGKSKGYGFITFKHIDGAMMALKEPSKKIDGRMTVTQLASAGTSGPASGAQTGDVSQRKIFVGNVPFDMSSDRLLSHFSTYGEIEEGPLGFDKQTGKSRGFALFVFKAPEAARAALAEPNKMVDGHQLVCKLAIDGKKQGSGGAANAPPVGGVQMQQPPMTDGSDGLGSSYGVSGGMGSYGGFSSGHHHLPPSISAPSSGVGAYGTPTGSTAGSYGATGSAGIGAYGSSGGGFSGSYGSSQYGGPGSVGQYGGSQYGGPVSGGYGGLASGSSIYRGPPSSTAMPSSAFPEGGHYGLSSSTYQNQQHHQQSGSSPAPRSAPGGIYQGPPSYY